MTLGDGVLFGPNVLVEEGTRIGEASVIEGGTLLGKVPRLARTSASRAEPLPALRLGVRVTICAGRDRLRRLGRSATRRSSATRPRSASARSSGRRRSIGRGSAIDNDVMIGARVKIQSNVYVTAFSVVEDDVFVGPGASTTNDDTMSRHARAYALRGATLRRACRIGGGAVLVPASRSARRRSSPPARS